MNYTLNQLQIFLKVTQTQSVTKAAEELNLTQPAVSIQIKNLQDQFDIPLTEVVGRKIYITDFGKELARSAEEIINQVYAINYKTLSYKGQLTGRLKISVVSTGKYVMPYFLVGFLKQHPGVELIMDVTNKSKVIESLKKNEVDFSLVSIVPEFLAVNTVKLLDNNLYLVGGKETKSMKGMDIKELFDQIPLIFREEGSGTRQAMEDFLQTHSLPNHKKMELTSNEAVKQAIIAGLGYSIMPILGIKPELDNGSIKVIPLKGLPIKTTWRLIWLKGKNLSPVAASFLEYLNKEKNTIIKEWFNDLDKV